MIELLNDLQTRGFSYLFTLKDEHIYCKNFVLDFDEFEIIEIYNLQIDSIKKEKILYAICCNKLNIKGIIVTESDSSTNLFTTVPKDKILKHGNAHYK